MDDGLTTLIVATNAAPNVLAILAAGMGLAFWIADPQSPTSRMLAFALIWVGVAIVLDVNFVHAASADNLPLLGWLSAPADALAFVCFGEWILRIRRTIPAGDLDTRAGDYLVRTTQLLAAFYAVVGTALAPVRAEYFLGAFGKTGVLAEPEFWWFAAPLGLGMLAMAFAIRLVLYRKPDAGERARLLAFIVAAPLLSSGLVTPAPLSSYTTAVGLVILLVGALRFHILQGRTGEFMRRFLAPQVADLVRQRGLRQSISSETMDISVVACDVRGFTAFAEDVPSDRVIQGLRIYYDHVGEIAARHGATIKDYAGDGVLMLVGAPLHTPDHAARALRLAEDLIADCVPLMQRFSFDEHTLGFGVGVATGPATVGIVGGDRLEYAAVGAVVNRAARLCAAAISGQVLIDAPTQSAVAGTPAARALDRHGDLQLKGIGQAVETYTLV